MRTDWNGVRREIPISALFRAALTGAALFLLTTAGCGGGDHSDDASTPAPSTTPVVVPTVPVTEPSPASGTLTFSVTSPSAGSNMNPAPVAGQVTSGTLGAFQGTPRDLTLTASNGTTSSGTTYSFSLALSSHAGLQTGMAYTVGSLSGGALDISYTEFPNVTASHVWTAAPGSGTVTIDAISGDTVTLHGSARMQPSAASSGGAAGTFTLNFSGTVTLSPQ